MNNTQTEIPTPLANLFEAFDQASPTTLFQQTERFFRDLNEMEFDDIVPAYQAFKVSYNEMPSNHRHKGVMDDIHEAILSRMVSISRETKIRLGTTDTAASVFARITGKDRGYFITS